MALDRWIALVIALVFLIYGHTAFFGMDDLLPPILKRNPIWPSTFPKILSIVGVLAAITVLLNFQEENNNASPFVELSPTDRVFCLRMSQPETLIKQHPIRFLILYYQLSVKHGLQPLSPRITPILPSAWIGLCV